MLYLKSKKISVLPRFTDVQMKLIQKELPKKELRKLKSEYLHFDHLQIRKICMHVFSKDNVEQIQKPFWQLQVPCLKSFQKLECKASTVLVMDANGYLKDNGGYGIFKNGGIMKVYLC